MKVATVEMKEVMLQEEIEGAKEVVTVAEVCKTGEGVHITRKTKLTKSMLQIFDVWLLLIIYLCSFF